MGSKSRLVTDLRQIITKNLDKDRYYVEPFAGGMNMISHIHHSKRIASDSNNYLIAMWRFLVWYGFEPNFPKTISKELYSHWRSIFNERGFRGDGMLDTEAMIGWIGFMGSFNGRFFDGGYSGHNVNGRDYIGEQIRNTLAQIEYLRGVEFRCGSYNAIDIPQGSIIYCDIPYQGTKQYSTSRGFDHISFWEWCREKTENGNEVLVSEYNAPNDFVCVWEKRITNSMNTKNTYKPTERLFVHESISDKYRIDKLALY